MFPINRVVALLTPVFTVASAAASAWALKHFPGLPVPSTAELVGAEVTAASAAAGAALKWLHGHQQYEAGLRRAAEVAQAIAKDAEKVDPGITAYVEQLVKSEVEKATPGLPPVLQALAAEGLAAVAASPDGKDGPHVALATEASETAAQVPVAPVAPAQGV